MKVVFYKGQKKFTVDNITISDIQRLSNLLKQDEDNEMALEDRELYDFKITSTRSVLCDEEGIEDEGLVKEIEEGVHWQQETVH